MIIAHPWLYFSTPDPVILTGDYRVATEPKIQEHFCMGFHFQFTVKDANRLLLVLILFEIFLTLMFAIDGQFKISRPFHRLFDLDGEATIPSWFSSMQLFLIGIVFLFSKQWPQKHQIVASGWLFFAGLGFMFLSADEAAVIHEKITRALKHIEWMPRFKGNHGIWIPVYLSVATVFAIMARRTIYSVFRVYPRQTKIMFSGMVIFLMGAVGLEILSYWYFRGTQYPVLSQIEVGLEELFEMVGASIILYGSILCALRGPQFFESSEPEPAGLSTPGTY